MFSEFCLLNYFFLVIYHRPACDQHNPGSGENELLAVSYHDFLLLLNRKKNACELKEGGGP